MADDDPYCSKCRTRKPLDEFRVKAGRREPWCKECQRAQWRSDQERMKARKSGRE
jgi:hypothetical protein